MFFLLKLIARGLCHFLRATPVAPKYNSPSKMLTEKTQYCFSNYWERCFCRSSITHPQYKWVLLVNEKFIFSFFPPFPSPTRSSLFPCSQFILFPFLLLILSQLPCWWATSSRQPDRNVLGNEAWARALGRTSRSQPWRGPFSPPDPCHGLLSGTSIRISLPCLPAFCYYCTTKDFMTTCSVHYKIQDLRSITWTNMHRPIT